MKKSKNIYLAIAGCICCLIAVLIVQCFVTYTLYQNSLKIEKRYLQETINDTYGHDTGDYVLSEIVNVVKNNIRHEDFIIRWGGDEFIVIFSQVHDANKCLRKLNTCISEHNFVDKNGNKISVTISIGAGSFQKTDASIHDLLRRIDKNLYKAKETRNTFCLE